MGSDTPPLTLRVQMAEGHASRSSLSEGRWTVEAPAKGLICAPNDSLSLASAGSV